MAKKNVKEEIVNAARRLFNQRGYANVSMRDVADALGISVGNLTYHYPKKEDLLDAVVEEMHRYYVAPAVPATLQQLNAIFAQMQNNIQQNAFYYWHYTQLAEISPKVHDIQAQVQQDHYTMLTEGFARLRAAGLMEAEAYTGQYLQVAQAVRIVCNYWVPQSKLEDGMDTPRDFLDCVWGVLFPLLTPHGKDTYHEIQRVRTVFEAISANPMP